jgi:hypothetical protein
MAHRHHRKHATIAGDLTAEQAQASQAAASLAQQLGIHPATLASSPPGTPASAAAAMASAKKQVGEGKGHKPSFLLKKVVGPINVAELLVAAVVAGGGAFLYFHHKHKR